MADFFSRLRRAAGVGASAATGASAGDTPAESVGVPLTGEEQGSGLDIWLERDEDENQTWASGRPGPRAADVATRISAVPKSFLEDDIDLPGLAGDVFDELFPTDPPPASPIGQPGALVDVLDAIAGGPSPAARRAAGIGVWIFASVDDFGPFDPPLLQYWAPRAIAALAWRLAPIVDPADWLSDAERRDEAARTFLLWSGHLPGGEDEATARGLFAMRDSLGRNQAMAAALREQQHRLDVTRKLMEARAREAAARPSSE